MTNKVSEFLRKHDSCEDGLEWAVENCKTMEDVWNTAKPEWLIWIATRGGVLPEMDLHRFACWSVRQVWDLLTDERSRNAIEVKEKWTEGQATDKELTAAGAAARAAVRDAAGAAACDAAWSATGSATRAAAWNASRKKQAQYIRDTFTPNFK